MLSMTSGHNIPLFYSHLTILLMFTLLMSLLAYLIISSDKYYLQSKEYLCSEVQVAGESKTCSKPKKAVTNFKMGKKHAKKSSQKKVSSKKSSSTRSMTQKSFKEKVSSKKSSASRSLTKKSISRQGKSARKSVGNKVKSF